jgi:outer membrane receptor protein involved in Fe transport
MMDRDSRQCAVRGIRALITLLILLAPFAARHAAAAAPTPATVTATATATAAQAEMATLTGTVKDEQGGVLPGATVSVVNRGTSAMREATTTGEGNFVLPLLQPGTYTVTVRMEGFAPVELRDVVLDVGERRSLALTLSVGTVGETVIVNAGASVIQADSGAIGNSRYEAQIKSLPVAVREVQSLIGLTAGVPSGSTSTVGGGFQRGNRSGVQVLADGVQVNPMQTEAWPAIDGIGRRADLNIPGIDTLTEVKVVTNGANAEYAQPTQAIIASKSGTNSFTGSVFEFYRSGNMAARRWEAPAKESFNRHQFGGTAGGPLVRGEMFYFVGFEGFRHKATSSFSARYPTDAERGGDLSALLNRTSATGALAPITIYDPLTGQPFAGNVIPASRISPVARELLTMIPSVSGTGSTLTAFNASYSKPLYDYSEKYDARVDLNLGSRNRFFGKTTIGHLDQFSRFAGDVPGDYGFSTKNEWTQTVLGNFTRTINDTTLLVLQASYRSTPFINIPSGGDSAFAVPIEGVNPAPPYAGPPAIAIGTNGLGISPLFDRLLFNVSSDYSISLDPSVTKTMGNHTMKVGMMYWQGWKTRELASPPYGRYTTASDFNNPRSTTSATGDAFADFLLGYPSTTDVTIGQVGGFFQKRNVSFYVQDDWRLGSKLSLYLGVRYDNFGFFTEENGWYANASFDRGLVIVPDGSLAKVHPAFAQYANLYVEAGDVGLSNTLVKPNNRDFAPRLGASYRLSPRTVLRGNFGVYYVDYTANSFQDALNAPPFVRRAQLTRSQLVGAGTPVNSIYTFQNPSAGGSDAGAAAQLANLVGTAEKYPTQRSYSWNLTVEQEIGWQTGVRASYVGNLSRHLSRNVRVNSCVPGPTECLQRAANAADGRRWTAFNTNMGMAANDADANYHGLELEVQRRMSDGLLFNANYTVASLNGYAADASNPVSEPFWDYDWGPIGPPRHIAHANVIYELPIGRDRAFGKNLSKGLDAVIGGWSLSGVWSYQSGDFLNITANVGQTPTSATTNRADLAGDPALGGGRPRNEQARAWFNTAAFATPSFVNPAATRPTRQFGTSPLGVITGPSFWSFDAVLTKGFQAGPARLQLRVEVYNPFNVPMLGNPITEVSNANFGQILTSRLAYLPRTLQIGTRLDW